MSDKAIFLASISYAPYLAGGVGFRHTQYNAPFGINEVGSFPARAHGAVDVAQYVRGVCCSCFLWPLYCLHRANSSWVFLPSSYVPCPANGHGTDAKLSSTLPEISLLLAFSKKSTFQCLASSAPIRSQLVSYAAFSKNSSQSSCGIFLTLDGDIFHLIYIYVYLWIKWIVECCVLLCIALYKRYANIHLSYPNYAESVP